MNLLTNPLNRRSTIRHVDVMVYLIGVSPLMELGVRAFTVGHASLKDVSRKVVKHEKASTDNQHVFISFAFDTFGFLTLGVVDLLHRVQRDMHNNVISPRFMNVAFTMIDFVI